MARDVRMGKAGGEYVGRLMRVVGLFRVGEKRLVHTFTLGHGGGGGHCVMCGLFAVW